MSRAAAPHHDDQGRRSDEAPDEVGVQAEPAAAGTQVDIRRLGRGQTSPQDRRKSWKLPEFQDWTFSRPEPFLSPKQNKQRLAEAKRGTPLTANG